MSHDVVPLTVAQVRRETKDACTLVFEKPTGAAQRFGGRAGQYLVLRVRIERFVAPDADDDLSEVIAGAQVEARFDGRTYAASVSGGESVLEAFRGRCDRGCSGRRRFEYRSRATDMRGRMIPTRRKTWQSRSRSARRI